MDDDSDAALSWRRRESRKGSSGAVPGHVDAFNAARVPLEIGVSAGGEHDAANGLFSQDALQSVGGILIATHHYLQQFRREHEKQTGIV